MPREEHVSAIQTFAADSTRPAPEPVWLEIPKLAAMLLWRHWPALLFWFFAQRVAYDLLMDAAIRLAEHGALLSYAAIAVLIVTQLVGTIGMFLVLRPSLSLPAGGAAVERPIDPWITALAVALLPFFAYYVSWGLLEGVRRDFRITYGMSVSFENREDLRDIFSLNGLWFALLAAWVVREVAKRRMAATGHSAWAVVTTICEAYWVFVGVAAIARGLGMLRDWWHGRAAYVAVADWWDNPFVGLVSLAPLKRMVDPFWQFAATAAGAVSMPLVWLAITALIYGLDLRRQQRLDRSDARVRYVVRRYARLHSTWHMVANKLSAGWNSKGVPLLNSLRLVLRAGLPALLTLCLCWQLLAFVDGTVWLVLVEFLGARSHEEWTVIGQPWSLLLSSPLGVRPALLTEMLRVALLAATFACAISQVTAARARGRDRS
jgi:hypothetical protein